MEVEEVEDEDDHNKPEVEVIDVLSSDDDSNSCEGVHPNDLLLVQLSEGEEEAHSEYHRTFRWPNYVKPLDLTTQSSKKDKKEKWLASDEFKKLLHNCEICGVHFEDHKNLLEHIVIHSRKNKKSEENIKLNILKRKSPMVIKHYFMCELCQKKFRGKKDLEYHIVKHHLEFEICIYCRRGFPTTKEMVDHRLICRSKILKYSCNKCRAKFRSKAKLRIHVVEERCSQYTCSICELVFGNVQSLISHENRHTGKVVKGFKCKVCNKSFLYDYSLAAHMKCHEEIDELPAFYHCDVCKKNYKRKDSFMRHLEAHNPAARKHHCTECELSFIQLSGLRQHIAVSHNKEKRFECEICHMRFGTSTIRNNHIRSVHLNIKEVMCTVCGKMFKKKTHLKNHMLIHTGETPYPCKACDKRFQTRGNLFAHEIRVHNILPWKCAQCGECFKQKVLLATHKSEQHRKS
jgi:KRAB domain-containing zinc finger protein